MKRKRILITGATGFVGACLLHRLINDGFSNLSIIVRRNSNIWRIKSVLDKVKVYYSDLLDLERLKKVVLKIKPEIVYHLATYGAYPGFQENIKKIYETNLFGAINLLNASAKAGFERFINTSSSSEYGEKKEPMRENDLLKPNSDYGVSKASATLYCQNFARQNSLPVITFRLFSPYGYYENQNRLIPYVILSCLSGKNPKLSSPRSVRDFVFIEDVVESYIKVLNSQNSFGQIFNIGTGEQHLVSEVVDKIIEITGSGIKPEWDVVNNMRNEPLVWVADISKAKSVLSWSPRYSLEKGLSKSVRWFEKNISVYYKNL